MIPVLKSEVHIEREVLKVYFNTPVNIQIYTGEVQFANPPATPGLGDLLLYINQLSAAQLNPCNPKNQITTPVAALYIPVRPEFVAHRLSKRP